MNARMSMSGIDRLRQNASRLRRLERHETSVAARRSRDALQMKRGGGDRLSRDEPASRREATVKRDCDRSRIERRDAARHQKVAKVAVRLETAGATSLDSRIAGKIHRIGDDSGGRVGLRRARRKDRDRIRDPKREAAARRAGRGDPADPVRRHEFARGQTKPGGQAC